ncbi:MAG: hypothetical protein SWE60_21530 [Thermodesulfobacteriota bacterium]|nr:hypothetical protein [Thermodesulfobacteriota bacterium]
MTEKTLFAELIKDLDPFDRKVLFALDQLREDQHHTMTIQTSRFELLSLLRLAYNPDNVKALDQSLERLEKTPLFLQGPGAGFAIATRTVAASQQEEGSEKLVISLGKLFTLDA